MSKYVDTTDRHKPDNITITIRARKAWIDRLDAAAKAVSESRMAYIRRAVEERMQREIGEMSHSQ